MKSFPGPNRKESSSNPTCFRGELLDFGGVVVFFCLEGVCRGKGSEGLKHSEDGELR